MSSGSSLQGMFEPYLKSFYIRSTDPTQIKILKVRATHLPTGTPTTCHPSSLWATQVWYPVTQVPLTAFGPGLKACGVSVLGWVWRLAGQGSPEVPVSVCISVSAGGPHQPGQRGQHPHSPA